MDSRRALMDRLLLRAVPRPVDADRSPPRALGDGVWVLDRQLQHLGFARLPSRSTIVRLGDGSLVVIAPPPDVDGRLKASLDALGPVRDVVVPNSFHYLFAASFLRLYPQARLLAAPALGQRVPALEHATELDSNPPVEWRGELDFVVLGPVRGLSELLLFHTPSRTLILTDLAFNMTRYPRMLDRIFWRLSGIPAGFGTGRDARMLLLRDRALAARCLSRALRWPIRRVVVAHGEVLDRDAPAQLRRVFASYLAASP